MSIYLSQHGKSAAKSEDPRRGLTAEGAAEVERVARIMAESDCPVDIIWHSGKARAAQTAEIFAAALNPADGVRTREGIDPLDDVTALAAHLDEDRNEMFVGHLPFMERMISYLILGDPERRVLRFRNGGVVCVDWHADESRWTIDWAVYP